MRILDAPIEQVVTIPAGERYPGDWRVIKGLTQPELAAAAKIATTTLRGIERADAALTDGNAEKLAKHLGHQRRGVPRRLPARPPAPSRHPCVTGAASSANMDSRQLAARERDPQPSRLWPTGVVDSASAAVKGLPARCFTPMSSSAIRN